MKSESQQITQILEKSNNIVILFSHAQDGDSIASVLAFSLLLEKMGKKTSIATITKENKNPSKKNNSKIFSFLPKFNTIKNSLDHLRDFIISLDIRNSQVGQIKYQLNSDTLDFIISPKNGFFTSENIKCRYEKFKYDLIITINTQDLESLGKIYDNDTEFFYKTNIINIDNNPENEEFGQINLIDLNTTSTSEIIFNLWQNLFPHIQDEKIATCILAGIISKTKSFKTSNITPRTLDITSKLISLGANREEIVNRLYRSKKITTLKLWGKLLSNLKSAIDDQLLWSFIYLNNFIEDESDIETSLLEAIDELIINIPNAKLVLFFYESGKDFNKKTGILIYSVKNINILSLLAEYNPQGTKKIAHLQIPKSFYEIEEIFMTNLQKKLERIL